MKFNRPATGLIRCIPMSKNHKYFLNFRKVPRKNLRTPQSPSFYIFKTLSGSSGTSYRLGPNIFGTSSMRRVEWAMNDPAYATLKNAYATLKNRVKSRKKSRKIVKKRKNSWKTTPTYRLRTAHATPTHRPRTVIPLYGCRDRVRGQNMSKFLDFTIVYLL